MPPIAVEILVAGLVPLVTVIVAHILSQRAGEKRANQVRVELAEKIDTLENRSAGCA
jgi:endonuclease III